MNGFYVSNVVIDDSRLTCTQGTVYTALCYFKQVHNNDHPSISEIKRKARLKSNNTVCDAIKKLEELGYIECVRENGKPTVYDLILEGSDFNEAQGTD